MNQSNAQGGVWWPKSAAATCHPRKATVALAEQAESAGVTVVEGAEVSDLDVEKGREWRVSYRMLKNRSVSMIFSEKIGLIEAETQNLTSLPTQHSSDARLDLGDDAEEREVKADVVVLAAGGWCPYLGELAGGGSSLWVVCCRLGGLAG